jgi:Glucose/sorbosone dehydrogenases
MALKPCRVLFVLSFLTCLQSHLLAQAPNNTCANATTLTVSGDCTPIQGDLFNASSTNVGCGNRRDVWYRFVLPSNSTFVTVTITPIAPTNINPNNVYVEMFNTRNCTLSGTAFGGCQNITQSRTYTGLMPDSVYYFRINTTQNTSSGVNSWKFNVCLTSNDTISNATTIVPGNTVDGNLFGVSADPSIPLGCGWGDPDDDVWYKFTAAYHNATITLSNIGDTLLKYGPMLQLYSGAPGALTPVSCGQGIINQASGLIPGDTYYVRVYSAVSGQAGFSLGTAGFRIAVSPSAPTMVTAGRMREVYKQTILSTVNTLADPWEITLGPDNKLWITESKGYRLYRMDPLSGARDTALDISRNSTFLLPGDTSFNCQFTVAGVANPQGGFAGMALHPQFLDPVSPKNYVYVSYVRSFVSQNDPYGRIFINRLARFTFDPVTGKLHSPVSLCDTLPGSNDHNSQRMIIGPVDGTYYLFYASGDMGAGQFSNRLRPNRAQDSLSYEGKILRFNLESDGEGGLDGWIPNDNPYNSGSFQSAVWAIGIRNNQGFAYDSTLDILYGSSHGPYSDDEINIIERRKNYGHPIVIGYAADNNYNGTTAGAPLTDNGGVSSCPEITNEQGEASLIYNYKDPLFSAYAAPEAQITNIWQTNPGNGGWPSEGWSGLDLYQHTLIPGWHKSLVAASLKWGRLVRLRLYAGGDSIAKIGAADTASYFGSINRFRDLALTADGKDIYVIMDRSATTSGPSFANPVIPACGGCVQKYSFIGYADVGGKSNIPPTINISAGIDNSVAPATTVTIDSENSHYWVPITGPDGDIVAEIYANGQTLGKVTTAFYKNSINKELRRRGYTRYLDRNITINAEFPPSSPVKVRFYITKEEYDRLAAEELSHINSLSDLMIHQNNDTCQSAISGITTMIGPDFRDAHDTLGFVLQVNNITSLSSFYFGADNITLPVNLLTFTGQYKNGASHLKWETSSEVNTDYFVVERSLPGGNFGETGKVVAKGSSNQKARYNYVDENIASLGAPYLLYRLKMVDKDGMYSYSQIVQIHLPEILTTIVNIFPNPANHTTTLSITSPRDQRVTWQVVDNTGRTVLSSREQVRKGNTRIIIDLSAVPAGNYFLRVNGQYVNSVQKLQKL